LVIVLETIMEKPQGQPSRRGLLFGTAAVGAIAATVAVLPAAKVNQAAALQPSKPAPEKGGGYSVSEHVKHYYRTALV
jgi:hypothetical protein